MAIVAKNGKKDVDLGMVADRSRLLPESEVTAQMDAIWQPIQKKLSKRQCYNCRKAGIEERYYPAVYKGKCVRCGATLSEPGIGC